MGPRLWAHTHWMTYAVFQISGNWDAHETRTQPPRRSPAGALCFYNGEAAFETTLQKRRPGCTEVVCAPAPATAAGVLARAAPGWTVIASGLCCFERPSLQSVADLLRHSAVCASLHSPRASIAWLCRSARSLATVCNFLVLHGNNNLDTSVSWASIDQ